MSTTKANFATHLDEWLPSQSKRHQPCHHVETLSRRKALPFGCSTARFRGAVATS